MTIDLTDADRAAIRKAIASGEEMDEAIYRAGIRAGLERAAKVCLADIDPDCGCDRCETAQFCANEIRSLISKEK